ncbi:MAG: TRAP transporter small permease [Treponemataceae bacterium]
MTIKKILNEFELYIGAVISGAMFLVLLGQVISRYVFNSAFSWSEELALILFIWSIYFGATAAIRRHQHLRLEIVLDKVSPKLKLIFIIFGNFCFALFNCIILIGVMPIVQRLFASGTATAVLEIPKWFNYSILPTIFVLMIVRLIQDSVISVQDFRKLNPGN